VEEPKFKPRSLWLQHMQCFYYCLLPPHLAKDPGTILRVMGNHRNFKGPSILSHHCYRLMGIQKAFFFFKILFIEREHVGGAEGRKRERERISSRV